MGLRDRVGRQVDTFGRRVREIESVDQATQLTLMNQYRLMQALGHQLPRLQEVELRVHSQNGEDGILLYLFALAGATDRRCLELCAGDGLECNTANLILNHGWRGTLVDGDAANVARGQSFYAQHPNTWQRPPTFLNTWLDRESAPQLVAKQGFAGSFDLLSLDVDGNDYWLLESILPLVRPRVIVLECSAEWGPSAAVTVPYDARFVRDDRKRPGYSGASLPAFVQLLKDTHRLVGLERLGYNAFFVARGVAEKELPERDPKELYDLIGWQPEWAEQVRRWPWVTLDGADS